MKEAFLKYVVLVSSRCHNKIPQTLWLNRSLFSHSSGVWKVQDQGYRRFLVRAFFLVFTWPLCPHIAFPLIAERELSTLLMTLIKAPPHSSYSFLLYWGTCPFFLPKVNFSKFVRFFSRIMFLCLHHLAPESSATPSLVDYVVVSPTI